VERSDTHQVAAMMGIATLHPSYMYFGSGFSPAADRDDDFQFVPIGQ